ncbi:MAG: hypothetical protein WCN95_08575, partial [bacterium]
CLSFSGVACGDGNNSGSVPNPIILVCEVICIILACFACVGAIVGVFGLHCSPNGRILFHSD